MNFLSNPAVDSSHLARDRSTSERVTGLCFWGIGLIVAAGFCCLAYSVVSRGVGQLSLSFLIEAPRQAGRAGGIFPILVSTLGVVGIALAVAVPLGLGTAVCLTEFTQRNSRLARLVGRSLDLLASVPSIVFGLFGNALFCQWLGLGYSLLSGGLTLACMVLPILIRALEASLRAVPDDYRHAGAALGLTRTRITLSVLLPAAWPGLVAGVILGIGRVLAETAALLFTSGYVDRMPTSPFDSGRTLSVHLYDLALNVPGGEPRAAATGLVLAGLLVLLNLGSIALVRFTVGQHRETS